MFDRKFPTEAREVAQPVKALTSKPAYLNLIPGTHMVGTENQLPYVALWPPYEDKKKT